MFDKAVPCEEKKNVTLVRSPTYICLKRQKLEKRLEGTCAAVCLPEASRGDVCAGGCAKEPGLEHLREGLFGQDSLLLWEYSRLGLVFP